MSWMIRMSPPFFVADISEKGRERTDEKLYDCFAIVFSELCVRKKWNVFPVVVI